MRLLTHGLSTAVTTLAGSTALLPQTADAAYGAQSFAKVEKITVMVGGTTIAPASSEGLVQFRYGDSSGVAGTTMVICPQPNCTGGAPNGVFQVELDGLGIKTRWFEAITITTCAGGVGVYIFGE